jgi:hypothetical protein
MPIQFSENQMRAFDKAIVEATALRIANAAQALHSDICAEAAAENGSSLLDFVVGICERGYAIGLSKLDDLAAFVAIFLSEQRFAPALPQIFTFIEETLGMDEPGYAILGKIEGRLADDTADVAIVSKLEAFIREMRTSV